MFAIDSETTGLDVRHGATPFIVTICYENGQQKLYEWDVNPYNRQVEVLPEDLEEIQNELRRVNNWERTTGNQESRESHSIVTQNGKFDATAFSRIKGWNTPWPWRMNHDTLTAAHLLCSNRPHDLYSLAVQYLGERKENLEAVEEKMKKAVQKARDYCRRHMPDWMIAEEGLACMPSAKSGKKKSRSGEADKVWKYDLWLPRTVALEEDYYEESHELGYWHTVTRDYANLDSALTMGLWPVLKAELIRRDLWEHYLEQRKLTSCLQRMESKGITVNGITLNDKMKEYTRESERLGQICINIAKSYKHKLDLGSGGRSDSLAAFIFDVLKLESDKETKPGSGNPSMDKHVLDHWKKSLDPNTKQLTFIESLIDKRAMDTAIGYMKSYRKFWRPIVDPRANEGTPNNALSRSWYTLHPSFNQTGTDTTRMSCQNPNVQQISKREKVNIRDCFGPEPEYLWASADAQNIELRIPTYESGEPDLIAIFERPNDPPYFGSYHLVIFDLLHPELFREYGKDCKNVFEATWYQWVKNGNFAVIYGAQRRKADETYHVEGAYDKIRYRFPRIAALGDRMIKMANKNGYIETMPRKNVNPRKGYPLWCSRTNDGKIMPTVPLNYHVQGTASEWMRGAIIKVDEYLENHPESNIDMILTVHDELDFRLPREATPEVLYKKTDPKPKDPYFKDMKFMESSITHLTQIKSIMESCGRDIGIPTPVTVEIHPEKWSVGIPIAL